jgi:bifunctional DNA-binding transcriptional regulator/antitoxin component of YhaV-PrlF toxin-antitoxin module
MTSKTLSIGPRGQITLPKKLRDLFKSDSITIEIIDDKHAIISPVPDIGGVISEFQKITDLSFEEIREQAWIDSEENRVEQK